MNFGYGDVKRAANAETDVGGSVHDSVEIYCLESDFIVSRQKR